MKDAREAGALIIRHLAVIDEADGVLMDVQEKVFQAMDGLLKSFAGKQEWRGVFAYLEKDTCWFAPPAWKVPDGEEDEYFATFDVECNGDDDSYHLTGLCAAGDDEIGLRWNVVFGKFGGKPNWRKLARAANLRHTELAAAGFRFEDDTGAWFLPFNVDAGVLSQAYQDDDYDVALAPVTAALEKVAAALHVFDKILSEARASLPSQM